MCEKDKLRQAKKRDRKIEITDIAIEKVPHIEYKGFTPEQNDIMQQLVKEVLILSLVDLHFLLVYTRVKMLVVVSNQGTVHYIQKDKKFDRQAAVRLIKECADEYNISNSVVERYRAALTFLVRCSEVGLFYS